MKEIRRKIVNRFYVNAKNNSIIRELNNSENVLADQNIYVNPFTNVDVEVIEKSIVYTESGLEYPRLEMIVRFFERSDYY